MELHGKRSPIRLEAGGVIRVGNSRISCDLVIEQYENGMTPEDLVRAYDTLKLADAYGAIAYYLNHRQEIQEYLKRRSDEAAAMRSTIEAGRRRTPSREELVARRAAREQAHSPSDQ
jgi:uncharacterized protein (DUF433 family)